MAYKLTKKEKNEAMFNTWGRIISLAGLSEYGVPKFDKERIVALMEKFNEDLKRARVEENYFKMPLDNNTSGSNNEL